MPGVTTSAELDQALQALLEHHDCMLVSARHLALEARAAREERRYYCLETDSEQVDPYFHYVVDNATAAFLFDDEPFLIFVFRCNPHELITHVEASYGPDDAPACRDYVTTLLGKQADITIERALAYAWMDDMHAAHGGG